MALAEIVFLLAKICGYFTAGLQIFFIAFNVMKQFLPSLISASAPAAASMDGDGIHPPASLSAWRCGSPGGLLYGINGAVTVFGGGPILTLIWLAVSLTLRQPPYVSSLRLELPENDGIIRHCREITRQPGVRCGDYCANGRCM